MSWLKRIFGQDDDDAKKGRSGGRTAQASQSAATSRRSDSPGSNVNRGDQRPQSSNRMSNANESEVPPERMGLNGEYDQSGLAKRVAQAYDQDATLRDIDTVWVAQTGSKVVLKGTAPNQQVLDRMVTVAKGIRGATAVDIDQVTVS